MWRKTLREAEKTGSKTSPKSCPKLAKRTPFYKVQKTSRRAQFFGQTDRPVDQPMVKFMTVGAAGRPRSTARRS